MSSHPLKKIFFIVLLFFAVPSHAIDPAVQMQLNNLQEAVDQLRGSHPGFLIRTASGMVSTIITGIVIFVGSKWLIDSYMSAKNSRKKPTTGSVYRTTRGIFYLQKPGR